MHLASSHLADAEDCCISQCYTEYDIEIKLITKMCRNYNYDRVYRYFISLTGKEKISYNLQIESKSNQLYICLKPTVPKDYTKIIKDSARRCTGRERLANTIPHWRRK